MAAAYLVGTGGGVPGGGRTAQPAVGPPSIEQIHYGLNLGPAEAEQPPLSVMVLSRLVDAPRRVMSYL